MNLELLTRVLRRRYEIITASAPEQALQMLAELEDLALIISDYRMPQMNGAELLQRSIRHQPRAKRVLITGYADVDNVIEAVNAGNIHYVIKKPWKHAELQQVVEQLVHSHVLERENRALLGDLRRANDELFAKERLLVRSLDERGRELLTASSELERINRDLEARAYRDPLTGLYNHCAFRERLSEELVRSKRYGLPMSLLVGNIDRFGQVNEAVGYRRGDELLQRAAAALQQRDQSARDSDIAARYGGDTFAVLLPETNKPDAAAEAERLREAIAGCEAPGGSSLTISFGVSEFPEDAAQPEELVLRAVAALGEAKASGRNCVHVFVQRSEDSEASNSGEAAPAPTPPSMPGNDRFRTYHEQLGEIVAMLRRDRAINCLYVDLSRLRRLELELGVAQHAEVYDRAGEVLDGMRGAHLRTGDLICRTNDDDGYVCVLSPPRRQPRAELFDLEKIALRVAEAINAALSALVRELIRDEPRITVGHARVLNNSMTRPERLVERLIKEAQGAAQLAHERAAQRDKARLQEIILGEELTPVYQPIVHIESSTIFGYEALTRGPRQTNMESPATLFAIADEVDLTFELDRECFRGALRGAAGLEPVHRLFVNLLPLSFYDSAFIQDEISNLLAAAALTPANIVFEITERLAIDNFTMFRRALARYTAMGFGVAIDDVGTRHSNLETVMALRPHFIKISDVLSRGVAHSTVKREMLRSLGRIADAIDAVMIAEGIETADDLLVLHDLGVRYGQGFFLARPGPPFPRLRAEVRRTVRALAEGPHQPTAAPPAYDDDDDDDDRAAATTLAEGSGQVWLDEPPRLALPGEPGPRRAATRELGSENLDDDFAERTRPRVRSQTEERWQPLRLEDLGESSISNAVPLIRSLRDEQVGDPGSGEPSK